MDPISELTVSIPLRLGERVDAPVRSIDWGEFTVDFAASTAPVLAIGQNLELEFRGGGIEGVARVEGFVTQRSEGAATRSYKLQLDRGDGSALDAALNRRAHFRATPDPSAPVRVCLRGLLDGGMSVGGLLRDLSEGGLSVLVAREDEWTLAAFDQLAMEFRLPATSAMLTFQGSVRYRRLERTAVHYGVSFDPSAKGFEAGRSGLQAYLDSRRGDMMERLNRSSTDAA